MAIEAGTRVQSKMHASYIGTVIWVGSQNARMVVRWDCGDTQSVSPADLLVADDWWEGTTVIRRRDMLLIKAAIG